MPRLNDYSIEQIAEHLHIRLLLERSRIRQGQPADRARIALPALKHVVIEIEALTGVLSNRTLESDLREDR